MAKIELNQNIYSRSSFNKLIDNSFKQLLNNEEENIPLSIDDFFELYEELFYQIPKDNENNSHRYILDRTADYLGVKINEETDIQLLLEEITLLRNELLSANKALNNDK
jgi:hypothetical protein